MERGWLSLTEAAQYVGKHTDYLREVIALGELEAHDVGGSCRISVKDLDAFVSSTPPWMPRQVATPRGKK